jgi:hypothetical protein
MCTLLRVAGGTLAAAATTVCAELVMASCVMP